MRRIMLAVVTGVAFLWLGAAQAAVTPAQKCQTSKNKAAGKYAACRGTAEAKLAATGDSERYGESIAKCETKYQGAWQKAEQKAVKAGSSCTTTSDETDVKVTTDVYTDNVAQHLGGAPLADCPTDLMTCSTDLSTCSAGTAVAADVLGGKTFSSSAGLGDTGTMAANGAVTLTPSTTDQTIPAGYHDGSGKCVGDADLLSGNIKSGVNLFGVDGDSNVVDTSSGTAAAGDLLTGNSAWVAGAAVNGTMPNNGAVTLTPGTADQAIAAGYHNGSGKCAGDANLVSGNIKSGATIFGVSGSVLVASGDAAAADVLSGKTFSNASAVGTGSMPNNGAVVLTPSTSAQVIAAGYHNGAGRCAGDADLSSGNIRSGVNLFGVDGSPMVVNTAGTTATAADILSGQTAYANGSLLTGTAAPASDVNGGDGLNPFIIPDGVYSGSKTATANDTDLSASNIVNGVSIFGVTGTSAVVPSQVLKTGQTTAYGTGTDGDLQAGVARSYTDNGDGTITDNATGLMWEKKSSDSSIHDRYSSYTWGMNSGPYTMNGSMITSFLATLNAGGGFAGYTDWRIPNRFELMSILDLQNSSPAVDPVFNTGCVPGCTVTTCSCTLGQWYYSSTTYGAGPLAAFGVDFEFGYVAAINKATAYGVRAVRGGS